MAVLFPKLYISTDLGSDPIILDNVTKWARGTRVIRSSTYRDTGFDVGRIKQAGATASGFVAASDTLPVVGQNGATPLDKGLNGLIYTAPDEATHIPPRYKKARESGYLFGFTDAAIAESLPDDMPRSEHAFIAINTASDICVAGPNPFYTGDLIALYGTVMPSVSGVALTTATSQFTVVRIDGTSFMLRKSDGTLANFTAAGTDVGAVLVESAPTWVPPVPANEAGVIFVPDAWNPRISTTNPRA